MSDNNKKVLDNMVSRTKIYLVIIAVLLITICFFETRFILPGILVYVLILVYSAWTTDKKKGEITKHIQEITLDVDSAAKNTLINSPFPLVIMETDGNIIWKSSKFNKEFANIDINNYLTDIIKEVKQKIINEVENTRIEKYITIANKNYKIVGEYIKAKQKNRRDSTPEYLMTLYFMDNTGYSELEEKYNNSKTCIGIITVDNYEEIIQRASVEEKSKIIASIEKLIYDWAGKTGGLVIKTERETFIYVFEQKYLTEIENNKFEILDTIKSVKTKENLQLTLSIAISTEGENNYEKYKSALVMMDIALGRGGDQAVIKNKGRYQFFGGRTQELEKRTKVKARMISHALEELILRADNVMIMGHTNADIDSIGSSLGIYRLVKTLDKPAYIVNNTKGLTIDKFMEEIAKDEEYKEVVLNKNEAIAKITPETLLIIVDTHKKNYVEVPELLQKTDRIVVVDHHRKSTDFIEEPLLIFHEVYASSASELVIEILQYAERNVELKQIEVEALYAGIMIDTKNFTFKTGVRTFEAAAYLRKYGVDIIKVKKWFQSDLENYTIIADIVKKAEVVKESIGISTYDVQDKDTGIICAKAADELLTISDITASFVIGNDGEKCFISGRSIGDINVQVILEKLGRWRTYHIGRGSIRRN